MPTTYPVRPSKAVVFTDTTPQVTTRSTPLTIQVPAGITLTVEGSCDNDGVQAGNAVWGPLASIGGTTIAGPKLQKITEEVSALRFTPSGACTIFLAGEL